MSQQRNLALALSVLSALAIIATTLLPQRETAGLGAFWCILCGDYGPVDFLLNVLLFAPLGLSLTLAGMSRTQATIACLAATLGIEFLQWRMIPGRDATFGDIVANSVGGWLGASIALWWRSLVAATDTDARALGVSALTVWAGLVMLGALGVRPAPTTEAFFAQRAPRLAHLARFHGQLLEATIAGREAPSGPVPDHDALARRMHTGLAIGARVVPAGDTPGPAPIVSIFDRRRNEILLLGQEGADAIFRVRVAARDMSLRGPGVRLRAGLETSSAPNEDATAITLFGHVDRRELAVAAGAGRNLYATRLPLTAGLAWTFFMPTDIALVPGARWISALWLGLLLVPAAYWLARGSRSSSRSAWLWPVLLVGIVVLMLTLAPAIASIARTADAEWFGALSGTALGWYAGRTSGAPRRRGTGTR